MPDLSRRRFCLAAGGAMAASACGNGNKNGSDMNAGQPADMSFVNPFVNPDFACGGMVGGPYSSFAVGSATFYPCAHLFICRDALGVYAMTSVCTHEQCDITFDGSDMGPPGFTCFCHLSQFDFDGVVTHSPATRPLVHFQCTLDGSGNVVVDQTVIVPASTRLAAPGD